MATAEQEKKKEIVSYLSQVAEIKEWDPQIPGEPMIPAWFSKTDGSYLCFASSVEDVAWMADLNLTEIQSTRKEEGGTAQIGFCEKDQEWYGWSHKAVYSFGIGHTVKKGHAGYRAVDEQDFIKQCVNFYADEYCKDVVGLFTQNEKGEPGVQLTWVYSNDTPNESIRGTVGDTFMWLGSEGFGKGEWTSETLQDAKQMAIDFARSVS